MRTEVKDAIAHVVRGRIQNLEERTTRYEDEKALELRLILLKEGLRELEYKLVLDDRGTPGSADIGAP